MPREDFSVGDSRGFAFKRQPNYLEHIWKSDDESLTDQQALYNYSTEHYYRQINQSLRTDSGDLANNSGMVGAMRRAIKDHNEQGTVYRGMALSARRASAYKVGFKFLWPAFTSTSRDKSKAYKFGSPTNGDVKVMFTIDLDGPGVTFARGIEDFSAYPNEKEVVIYPYSGFEVTARSETSSGEVCISLRTYDTLLIERDGEPPDLADDDDTSDLADEDISDLSDAFKDDGAMSASSAWPCQAFVTIVIVVLAVFATYVA